ncbi:Cell death protease, partial [Physocladia obscura]
MQPQTKFAVIKLPGLSDAAFESLGPMHAGLMPTSADAGQSGSLFFWMIQARTIQATPKLIFWLNGGPGCSSMDGLFLENGPLIPQSDGSVGIRESSWWHVATTVYVDQPVGTGYAVPGKSGYVLSLKTVATDFAGFLNQFFIVFPALADFDIYIAGESFAGQYIPYIANNILTATDESSIIPKLKLKGLLIGNGWIDPHRQDSAVKATQKCEDHYTKSGKDPVKSNFCEGIMNFVLQNSTDTSDDHCINMYDIRLFDDRPDSCGLFSWPPHLDDMKAYLGRADVKSAVNVPNNGKDTKWTECVSTVGTALRGDTAAPSYTVEFNFS